MPWVTKRAIRAAAAVSFRVAPAAPIRSFAVYLFGLALANASRHELPAALRVVAIVALALLRTIVDARCDGADASPSARLKIVGARTMT
jgi:hypothetical protein